VRVGGNECDEVGGNVADKVADSRRGCYVGHAHDFGRVHHIRHVHHVGHVRGWFCDHLGGDMKHSRCWCWANCETCRSRRR
jgi:hypothetical protein